MILSEFIHRILSSLSSPSLYIINRDTLFEQIKVRQSSLEKDFKDVQQLVSNMNCELNIMAAFKKSEVQIFSAAATNNVLETELPEVSGEFSSFVATYAGQIVGVAIMKKMSDASSFIEQYEVEDYITTAHHSLSEKYSLLAHLILNPLFENQARWFIEVRV